MIAAGVLALSEPRSFLALILAVPVAGRLPACAWAWAWAWFFVAEFLLLDQALLGLAWQQALAQAVLHAVGLAVVAEVAFLILLPFVPFLLYSAYRLASNLSLALIAPFPSPRWVAPGKIALD